MVSIVTYISNGTTTDYTIPFEYLSRDHVVVELDDVTSTAFTFLNDTTLRLNASPISGVRVTIKRATPVEPLVDFTDGSTLFESDLDLSAQQSRLVGAEGRDRADEALNLINANIQDVQAVANIAADVSGVAAIASDVAAVAADAVDIGTVASSISGVNVLAPRAADIERLGDIEDGTLATNAIQTVAGISGNVTSVAGISGNVTTVAGISAQVTAVAGDAVDIGVVAANSANVSTVASISADVSSVAVNNANVTSVATDITNVNLVGSNINNVNTVAGITGNITTVATDSVSIGTVATNIAAVTSVSNNIADVNVAAANITDIQNAAANAATATTQATAASASAAAASTSETNAATSEANAAASASSALTAQTAAEAARDSALSAYDSFDDRYLGVKSSDPTLDNDGNALVGGSLYYNSIDQAMKVYTGSTWVAAYASLSGALLVTNNLSDLNDAASARGNLGLGSAATVNVGTSANQIVQLDGNGKLPAVDGSQLTGIEGVPSGVITMWSGSIASIPTGWVLCDGLNGTPDLRNRFVLAAGNNYVVGQTGGASSVALAVDNLPVHAHNFSGNAVTSDAGAHTPSGNISTGGSHSHSGSTSNTGAHQHTLTKYFAWGYQNVPGGSSEYNGAVNNWTSSAGAHSHNFNTNAGGDHSHTFTGSAVGNHTHNVSVSGATGATGAGSAINTMPPYYALAYIMKT